MARAVHRFERQSALIFRLGGEHILTEFFPMARGLPQAAINKLRGFHFAIASRIKTAANISFNFTLQHPSLGVPENRTGRFFLQVKQAKLTPQFAMVAFLGLFQHMKIGCQIFFSDPCRAVNPLQHRPG